MPKHTAHDATLRQRLGSVAAESFFRGASALGRLHPLARPERHGVRVLRDLPYLDDGRPEHRLDVYRPAGQPGKANGLLPVVLYIHGGGFRILSKDTHWLMGLSFARQGYLVFSINYRLAPRHPFPAAVEDVCAAWSWVLDHAAEHGGDPTRIVVAGESAGANLASALTLATCYRRPESEWGPWARAVYDRGVVPVAALPACGVFQVSDLERFSRRKRFSPWVNDRLLEVGIAYLGDDRHPDRAGDPRLDLANPLLFTERGAERGQRPERPLPPFFLPVGTHDLLLDDTRRFAAALTTLGAVAEPRYYPGEVHAFHAFVFREQARRCWQDTFAFLDRHLGSAKTSAA